MKRSIQIIFLNWGNGIRLAFWIIGTKFWKFADPCPPSIPLCGIIIYCKYIFLYNNNNDP